MTDSLIAAQAYAFFVAGFETSATTISYALYELAINREIQDKLREEFDEEYTKHGGNFTYENIKKMNYLDKVIKGTYVIRRKKIKEKDNIILIIILNF